MHTLPAEMLSGRKVHIAAASQVAEASM